MKTGVELSPIEQQEVVRTFKVGQKFNVVPYRGPSRIVAEAMRIFLEKNPEEFDISPLLVRIDEVKLDTLSDSIYEQSHDHYPIIYQVSFTATVLGFKKAAK